MPLAALWKLIGIRGAIGIGVALVLSLLLVIQKGETRHWHKLSDNYENQLRLEQKALAETVANYRAAADEAKRLDAANAARVHAEQSNINQETSDAYQKRLAAARADAERLRRSLAAASANPGSRTGTNVPSLSPAASGPAQAAGQNGLSDALTATEQAIQLDELIKWVKRQAGVNVNAQEPKP